MRNWTSRDRRTAFALHSALLPDGRVMTYGTDLNGKQTGKFFYDVWDPSGGTIAGGHLTLDNTTAPTSSAPAR